MLRKDNTITAHGSLYQIEEKTRAKHLTVEERTNGKIVISYKGNPLRYSKIEKGPKGAEEASSVQREAARKNPHTPPAERPCGTVAFG
ncbi:MAG: hypothetical protein ACUZ77_01820 [Candidatus Brocadiales bacterium]